MLRMTHRGSNQSVGSSRKEVGVMALVATAVCCGIPLLLGATSLALAGLAAGSTVVVIAAVAVGVVAVGRVRSRTVGGRACCPPDRTGAVDSDRESADN